MNDDDDKDDDDANDDDEISEGMKKWRNEGLKE
jgi:hypothetical protein